MSSFKIVAILALMLVPAAAEEFQHVAATDPLTPEEEQKKLHVPPGFEIQLVAAEPQIRKPMNFAFDDRGRIWATQSTEYPFPNSDEKTSRDCIQILEDENGDGRIDKVSTFATGLTIPIGILPIEKGAIVFSIPKIYRLIDADGDGKADEKQELYGTIGNADTHGLVNSFMRGFDGWIYACHGYANNSEVRGGDGSSIRMNSGNSFRFREDGSHVEYFTHGQVNPFGLCFDPLGNLYSADCHSQPVYTLLRGAYYPSFGKPHDGLGYGPEMTRNDHGSTAICGMVYYAADQFPAEYRDTVYIGNVWTNRVNHDRLEKHGSTLLAIRQPDFVRSEDPWFRPVYLQLGLDGALYIADFYNRIIGHYEVPLTHPGRDRERGRIWRVVHTGAGAPPAKAPRADWTAADIAALAGDLAHPNLAVRLKAAQQLVLRGAPALEALRRAASAPANAFQAAHALWALARLQALDGSLLEQAARSPEPLVRAHTRAILGEKAEWSPAEAELAVKGLTDGDPGVQRVSAQSLGLHPRQAFLAPLLALRKQAAPEDAFLVHVVRMALRNQLEALESWSVLENIAGSGGDADAIADAALGVRKAGAAQYLLQRLRAGDGASSDDQLQHLARNLPGPELPALLDLLKKTGGGKKRLPAGRIAAIIRVLGERGEPLGDAFTAWTAEAAAGMLAARDAATVLQGLELVQTARLKQAFAAVQGLARDAGRPPEVRKGALETLVASMPEEQIPLLGDLLASGEEALALRETAAELLGRIQQPRAVEVLAERLRTAPAALAAKIAEGLAATPDGCEKLMEEVSSGKASPRLLQSDRVARRMERNGNAAIRDRVAKLTAGLPEPEGGIVELIRKRRQAFNGFKVDLELGAKVFEKNCAPCHRLQEKGVKIGPDLNGIGTRGADRLLEDILDPNRNVDQAFRATLIILKNGLTQTGLVQNDEGSVVQLIDPQGKPVQIDKKDIRTREVSGLSPMPANLIEAIPENEFLHLLGFIMK